MLSGGSLRRVRITRTELRSDPIEHHGAVIVPVAQRIEVRWGRPNAGFGVGYAGPSHVETGDRSIRVIDWGLVLRLAVPTVVLLATIARRFGGRHGHGE